MPKRWNNYPYIWRYW